MPTVPTYDNFQASPAALPSVQVTTPTMPNTAGIAAKEMGHGMTQIGQSFGGEALKAMEEANNLRAEDAFNRMRQKQIDLAYGEAGAFRVEGANVLDRKSKLSFHDEYVQEFDKYASDIADTLANDDQRRKFASRAQSARLEFSGQLQRHQAAQVEKWRDGVLRDTVDTETRAALQNPYDPEAIGASVERIRLAVGGAAARNGIPADAAIARAVGGVHAGVIAQALNDDRLDYARQYLSEFGDEIDAKDRMRLGEALDARDREVRVMAVGEEAYQLHNDELVSGESFIMAKLKDDPKAAKAAIALYKERALTQRGEERRVEDDHLNAVLDMRVSGRSWRDIMRSNDWKAMDAKKRYQLFEDMQQERRAAAKAGNDGAKESRDELFNTIMADDDGIAAMSKAEIGTLRAKGLTQSQVGQLMRRKDAIAKGAEDVKVDSDQVNAAMLREGYGEKKKEDRGRIKAAIESEVYAEQKAKGRALTREEKDKIINRQFLEVKSQWKRTGGILDGQTGTDTKRYWEVGNKNSIMVPAKDRAAIIDELKRNGIRQWTEDDIRNLWLRKGR